MKKKDLEEFHQIQKEIVLSNSQRLKKQGLVKGYADIYPDVSKRIAHESRIAYLRGSASLKLMTLMYDAICVFVPPFSEKSLEARFQLPYRDFIELCRLGIVIPLIGDASKYQGKHFDSLFDPTCHVNSLWARGLGLLDAFGISNTLEVAKEVLPIDRIASDEAVIRWRSKGANQDKDGISGRIASDIAVQYADLCIFGLSNKIDGLQDENPLVIAKTLYTLNEMFTYPTLFGLNGQPNFAREKIDDMTMINIDPFVADPIPLSSDLDIMFRSIEVDPDSLTIKNIIDYRNTGVGENLRDALQSFNSTSTRFDNNTSDIQSSAELFQRKYQEAISELSSGTLFRRYDAVSRKLTYVFWIGGIALGGAIASIGALSVPALSIGIGGSGALVAAAMTKFPEKLAARLTAGYIEGTKSVFAANMWDARNKIRRG